MNDNNEVGNVKETRNWPELAIGLYDKLTGRGAEICYEFKDMEIWVPSKTGDDALHAKWKVNGAINIKTRDNYLDAKK